MTAVLILGISPGEFPQKCRIHPPAKREKEGEGKGGEGENPRKLLMAPGAKSLEYRLTDSVTCHLAALIFPPLLQPMLVLDFATQDLECKAELTWVVVISQDSINTKYGLISKKITGKCHGWELNLRPNVACLAS